MKEANGEDEGESRCCRVLVFPFLPRFLPGSWSLYLSGVVTALYRTSVCRRGIDRGSFFVRVPSPGSGGCMEDADLVRCTAQVFLCGLLRLSPIVPHFIFRRVASATEESPLILITSIALTLPAWTTNDCWRRAVLWRGWGVNPLYSNPNSPPRYSVPALLELPQ